LRDRARHDLADRGADDREHGDSGAEHHRPRLDDDHERPGRRSGHPDRVCAARPAYELPGLNPVAAAVDTGEMGLAAFALAPGLALGSFLNVVAARVPLRRSVVRPPSACMSCGTELSWRDNIPLVSYAVLRGRCRSCGMRIP